MLLPREHFLCAVTKKNRKKKKSSDGYSIPTVYHFDIESIRISRRASLLSSQGTASFTYEREKTDGRGCVRSVGAAWWFASRWNASWRPSRNQRNPRRRAGIPPRGRDASRHLVARRPSSSLIFRPVVHGRSASAISLFSSPEKPDIPTEKRRVARRTRRAFFSGSYVRP